MCRAIATLGPIGYLPFPGTMGTLATLPFIYLLHQFVINDFLQFTCVAIISFIGFCVIEYGWGLIDFEKDPQQIIMDEVIGTFITYLWIPLTWHSVLLGFLLFRFWDISKIGYVGHAEKLPRTWGIVFDDVVAGVIANLFLLVMFRFR